ncbi:hypothetical protein [Hydrogenophaga sp. NFH-34]|uniref:hypothetical protein n=1 Tax=Hydrogenophaga sp. NFH-34 TaxID=2744446 RepID=UPI001F2233D2|nr:hypothetical protein [Hydrogenophaga sp. NFH-34]
MPLSRIRFRPLVAAVLAGVLCFGLSSCGGSDSDDPIPTGGALADQWFQDTEGYYTLERARSDGSVIFTSSADFGTRNPDFQEGIRTMSAWAIDTSATPPEGKTLEYSMAIEGVTANADATAVNLLRSNLQLNGATGLMTQRCSGFPQCHDNMTQQTQTFRITTTAKVLGAKSGLNRSFLFHVHGD